MALNFERLSKLVKRNAYDYTGYEDREFVTQYLETIFPNTSRLINFDNLEEYFLDLMQEWIDNDPDYQNPHEQIIANGWFCSCEVHNDNTWYCQTHDGMYNLDVCQCDIFDCHCDCQMCSFQYELRYQTPWEIMDTINGEHETLFKYIMIDLVEELGFDLATYVVKPYFF